MSPHPYAHLFCPQCRNLLGLPGDSDYVSCHNCNAQVPTSTFESHVVTMRSHKLAPTRSLGQTDSKQPQGTMIREKCPKCGHPEMSFHTLQMRSADEGQTVFYACPKCAHKYSVNT